MKRRNLFLALLISALVVLGISAATVFADDDPDVVTGLRSSTHTITITNDTGDTVKVSGVAGPSDFTLEMEPGATEVCTDPDVITHIDSNDIIKFKGTQPAFEVSASLDENYKYCLSFTDTEEYPGDINLNLLKDKDSLLQTFCSNDGTDRVFYMTVKKNTAFNLPGSDAFDRDGYEITGWTMGSEEFKSGDEIALDQECTFYAGWQHVHAWVLFATGDNTAELECLNEGCDYDGPIELTFQADDATYTEDGYRDYNVMLTQSANIPEGVIAAESVVYKKQGRTIEKPADTGLYTAEITIDLLGDYGYSITLKDIFRIKKDVNVFTPQIEGWTVGDKPNKPDLSGAKSSHPLVLYTDEEGMAKILTVLLDLVWNNKQISIEDFKDINFRLIPPVKAGNYGIFVLGATRNYYDVGLGAFVVSERTGVLDAKVQSWTYGEYSADKNGPVVTVDGVDVTASSEVGYKSICAKDEEYAVFDPASAGDINAGVYLMRVRVTDNDAEDQTKETYRFFAVRKAYADADEPMAVRGLVANGSEQELVTHGTCDHGTFMYSMSTSRKTSGERIFTSEVPTASEAGTYYVWYRLCTDENYYSFVSVFPLKVTVSPAAEPESTEPEGSDGEAVIPGDQDGGGDSAQSDEPQTDTPQSDEPQADEPQSDTPQAADTTDKPAASRKDAKLPKVSLKTPGRANKSITVKWKKLSKNNQSKCQGIEIWVARDKKFKTGRIVKTTKKSNASYKIGKLARKKNYYVKVRTYKYDGNVKRVGKWSKVIRVKTR